MIGAALLLSGCGNKDEQGTENASDGLISDGQIVSTDVEKQDMEERVLTMQELKDFTYFINVDDNYGNYGFLLSEYGEPEQVDLHQVLYNGGGIQTEGLTEPERLAFEKTEEIYTDITKLTTKQIDDYLQRKMGISFADVTSEFLWTYLPEYDCYVSQHGDTNITNFICTRGLQIGDDLFELHFASVDNYDDCILTLRKVDGAYQFVSNEFTTNTDNIRNIFKIEEQSFDVELDDWGKVQFVAYAPNTYDYTNDDVVFELQREGETIFEFPGVQRDDGNGADNIRINDRFEAVLAVTFQDYNKDGYKDVVIINQYKNSLQTEETTYQYEARIYKGSEADFHYMESLSDDVNLSGMNGSIDKVMKQIEQHELNLTMLDESIKKQIETINRE